MKLAGSHILITGGTDGIGHQLALQLRAKGATVIVSGRDPGRLAVARAEGLEAIAADLSSAEGVDGLIEALGERTLDALVNNAGAGATYRVDEAIDLGEVERCLYLNLHAPIRLITLLLPRLRKRPQAMIVNVTSGLAIAPNSGSPVYCATKAALRSFTMSLRAQLASTPVQVLEVLPPVVETQLTAANRHRKMPAAECARRIVQAMERDRNEAFVGATAMLRNLFSASPALARRIMLRY
ncbi:MAG: SDR family oxidoreductase [Allosphingosinicella sp.]